MINEFSSTIVRCSIIFIDGALLYKSINLFLLYSKLITRSYNSSIFIPRGPMPHPYSSSLDCSIIFLDPGLALKSQMWSYHLLTVAYLNIILLESCTSKLFRLGSAIEFIWNGWKLAAFVNYIELISFELFKVLSEHAWIGSLELRSLSSTADCACLCSLDQVSLAVGRVYSNLRSFFFLNEYLYSVRCYYFLKFVPFVFYIECWLQSSHWM